MTGIIGLQGKFNGNLLNFMLKTLESNNNMKKEKYSKGIFLSSKRGTIFNKEFCNINLPNDEDNFYNIGLAYTSAINEDIRNNDSNSCYLQPTKYKNLVLIFDGIVYNTEEIYSILENDDDVDFINDMNNSFNPCIIIKLLYKFYFEYKDLKKSVKKTINLINGEYTFAVFENNNINNLAIVRDSVGFRPLYYNIQNDFYSFASEKKALWKIGIENNDIISLKPGYILYNWEEYPPSANIWDFDYFDKKHSFNKKNIDSSLNKNNTTPSSNIKNIDSSLNIKNMNYNEIKDNLLKLIEDSIYNRIKGLNHVGLVFSGGVDSTIIATLLKKYRQNHDIGITLYTVGDKDSKDLKYSKKVAKQLNLPLKSQVIDESNVRDSLTPVLEAIEEANLMKVGVGMTLFLASKLTANDGINVVLTGQGADELFAGYNRYLATLKIGGKTGLQRELIHDIEFCYDVNLERDAKIANASGVQIRVPYLDEKLINFSLNIPIKYKIDNNEDNLRKRILRDLAIDIGIDEKVAMRPKKAAQYGSGINKILKKKVLKDTDINQLMADIIDKYSNPQIT